MADTNYRILGSTLSAIANAVRDKTGRTDTMYPTEFADAIMSITGGGGAGGGVELLKEADYTFEETDGVYSIDIYAAFAAGTSYQVVWDTQTFTVEAVAVPESPVVIAGNLSLFEMGEDTGEPFLIVSEEGMGVMATLDGANHHVGVTLLGTIGVEMADIELDMADGAQIVLPSANDKLLSMVTIRKPNTLLPNNILKGVNIAGVIGSAVAGGGSGKTPKLVTGEFQTPSNYAVVTVTHGLGVRPDFLMVYAVASTALTDNKQLVFTCGISKALKAALGGSSYTYVQVEKEGMQTQGGVCFDEFETRHAYYHDDWAGMFVNDDKTFQIGAANASMCYLAKSGTYRYVAIGGLV